MPVRKAPITLELPSALRAWVRATAKAGNFETDSAFVRNLVKIERDRRLALEADLLEGLRSPPVDITLSEKDSIRGEVRAIAARRLRRKSA